MPIPDQNRVQELLRPHEEAIIQPFMRAWDRWLKNPERPVLYRRTRACLVHNYTMLDAIPGLPAHGIKVVERQAHETALFLVADELVFRYKKGNANGLSSNIGTQAALDFNDPNESLDLFDLPDICRVDVAYRLNDLETLFADVLIVARDNDRVLWSYSIMPRAAAAGDPTQLPVEPQQPPSADSGIRLPEADEEAKKQSNDGTE